MRMTGRRALLRAVVAVATVTLVVAGCSALPALSPTPAARSSAAPSAQRSTTPAATPSPAPTPSATPVPTPMPPLGAHWERVDGLPEDGVVDLAGGPNGWVAVGDICRECSAGARAAAWYSEDGVTWAAGTLPQSAGAWARSVATDGTTWFAAGERPFDDGSEHGTIQALVWRSTDGRRWTLTDTIDLGWCKEGCPWAEQLTAGPGGVLFNFVHTLDSHRAGVYWSGDGRDFRLVDKADFGLAPSAQFLASAVTVAGGRFLFVGEFGASTSGNGRTWTPLDTFADGITELDAASSGRRAVVAQRSCESRCPTEIRTTTNGGSTWTVASRTFEISGPRLTAAARTFLLVGQGAAGMLLYTSPDGIHWVERPRRDLPLQYCHISSLAGYGDRIFIVGAGETCDRGVWMTRAPA